MESQINTVLKKNVSSKKYNGGARLYSKIGCNSSNLMIGSATGPRAEPWMTFR